MPVPVIRAAERRIGVVVITRSSPRARTWNRDLSIELRLIKSAHVTGGMVFLTGLMIREYFARRR
jgi:hypothetical protein